MKKINAFANVAIINLSLVYLGIYPDIIEYNFFSHDEKF